MRKYSPSHEWVELKGNLATVGLTQKAVQEVGEVVFVELPQVGQKIAAGQEVVVLESTKAAIDICSPLSGEVIAVNEQLQSDAALINHSAEEKGWLFRMRPSDMTQFEELLTTQ